MRQLLNPLEIAFYVNYIQESISTLYITNSIFVRETSQLMQFWETVDVFW
jgi:hypothetical protein